VFEEKISKASLNAELTPMLRQNRCIKIGSKQKMARGNNYDVVRYIGAPSLHALCSVYVYTIVASDRSYLPGTLLICRAGEFIPISGAGKPIAL